MARADAVRVKDRNARGSTCDLHLHSVHSDGLASVEEVVRLAAELGRGVVALTDHDTVSGVEEAQAIGESVGVRVLVGAEITVGDPGGGERHVLAYGFDPDDAALSACLTRNRAARLERVQRMVDALLGAGVSVSREEVLSAAGAGAVGRPHVADALVRSGRVGSRQEAFDRWLGDGKVAHVRKDTIPAADAIAAVHGAGGVTVLAHPGRRWDEGTVEALVRAGLDGLESVHPSHGRDVVRKVEELARRFGLVTTGGSDNHGDRDGLDAMRALRVPVEVAVRLEERIARRATAVRSGGR